MIYSASLFAPEHHHGILIPICRSLPKKLPQGVEARLAKDHPLRDLLAPSAALLSQYKAMQKAHQVEVDRLKALGYEKPGEFLSHLAVCGSFDKAMNTPEPELPPDPEEFYVGQYREQLKSQGGTLRADLEALAKVGQDSTLLCWEKAGQFCHRNLVLQCVERWLPEHYGGRDIALPDCQAEAA